MKLNIKNYKCTEDEFNSFSTLEKRKYILQNEQEETMWWGRTYYKIMVISFVVSFALLILYISTK